MRWTMIFKKFEFPVLKVPVGNKVYIWLKKISTFCEFKK